MKVVVTRSECDNIFYARQCFFVSISSKRSYVAELSGFVVLFDLIDSLYRQSFQLIHLFLRHKTGRLRPFDVGLYVFYRTGIGKDARAYITKGLSGYHNMSEIPDDIVVESLRNLVNLF